MEKSKRISEGMKAQIGTRRKRGSNSGDDSQGRGIMSRSYYLDVIFIQIVLLLLLYGVCVFVVPTLPA
ncbi:hypothetical protein EQO05_08335 [Methanosarcina sp. MSH10X1]|nr:hypothetical protein EQO05_08335 [Methanosarcina sp. MSH10X1]